MSTVMLERNESAAAAVVDSLDFHEDDKAFAVNEETKPSSKRKSRALSLMAGALDQAAATGSITWEERAEVESLFLPNMERTDCLVASELIDQWETRTARVGSLDAAKEDPTFFELVHGQKSQSVIKAALGRLSTGPVTPQVLLLLHTIVGSAPARDATTVEAAAHAWLAWGKRQRLL